MKRTIISGAILSALSLAGSVQAATVDCTALPVWQPETTYSTDGKVQFENNAYQARWWSQGKSPATHSGDWQEWQWLGACSGYNALPEVTITSPLNNAQLSTGQIIGLQANASDIDGNVAQVEFFLSGVSLGVVTAAPYTLDWTTTTGSHTISAVVTDNLGATNEATVKISVSPAGDLVPPSIQLTSPTGSETLVQGDVLAITANASDTDGSVSKVEFYVDNALVATDTTAPFEHNWTAVAGSHVVSAKATDNDNQSTASQEVTVNVNSGSSGGCADAVPYVAGTAYSNGDLVENNNQKYRCDQAGWCSSSSAWAYEPGVGAHWQEAWTGLGACSAAPEVTLTAPATGDVILAGSTVAVSANASDADGTVTQVEFFANSTSIGIDTQAPYTVNWSATAVGETTVKAVATDNGGSTGEASALVTVSDQPVVTRLTAPANGSVVGVGKSTLVSADATSLTGTVQSVDFLVNGSVIASDTTAPYSTNWTPAAIGSYTLTVIAKDSAGNSAVSSGVTVSAVEQVAKKHNLIGYWHNFVNGSGCPIRLADMSERWDIIDIAFADNDRNSDGTVHFNLYSGDIHSTCPAMDPVQFKQDMAALQAKGKIFVLSLGGAEGTITLNTDQDEANFVSSLTAIIKEWGFDGLDVDLESGSNLVHGSQIQARLGRALKAIEANTGGDMYLTMAPEHPYVQGGMVAYTGIWGAYIPVIDQVRDTLDLLHVQLYNNGGLPNPYMPGAAPEGSVDMMVASAKMLVEGFALADGSQFAPLRDDQVAIGLPSGPSSANSGQAPVQNIYDALDCLIKGTKCSSVVPAKLYPNFGGVMTWSINWDQHDGFNFSVPVGNKLDQLNAGK
ncbi:chitinase [Vibrio nigripulchritudo]|uniref:Ig-like domain-containing protein n=1 Tax=Vibrio nigripulchritudo TaxID=28173 RepID=UPI00190C6962|nr:Ig-like domain-containing protein [Vibrio nigripulchritudo]BCL70828.1 chitinase [Vibrio nigripulchritudo]BDU32184.1 chitinase [Vibrio nigripulchritudo]